jgi:hypothetical protein
MSLDFLIVGNFDNSLKAALFLQSEIVCISRLKI